MYKTNCVVYVCMCVCMYLDDMIIKSKDVVIMRYVMRCHVTWWSVSILGMAMHGAGTTTNQCTILFLSIVLSFSNQLDNHLIGVLLLLLFLANGVFYSVQVVLHWWVFLPRLSPRDTMHMTGRFLHYSHWYASCVKLTCK